MEIILDNLILHQEMGNKEMSQEKVDAYKKEKAGRKARIAKHELHVKIAKITSIVVAIALVAAIAGSIVWNKVGGSSEAAEGATAEVSLDIAGTEESADDSASEASDNAASTEESAATAEESTEAASEASSN